MTLSGSKCGDMFKSSFASVNEALSSGCAFFSSVTV